MGEKCVRGWCVCVCVCVFVCVGGGVNHVRVSQPIYTCNRVLVAIQTVSHFCEGTLALLAHTVLLHLPVPFQDGPLAGADPSVLRPRVAGSERLPAPPAGRHAAARPDAPVLHHAVWAAPPHQLPALWTQARQVQGPDPRPQHGVVIQGSDSE